MTSANRQPEPSSPAGQAIDAQGQATAASELAERHHRTSKHRAPSRNVRPPIRRPADKTRGKSSGKGGGVSRLRLWMATETLSSRLIRIGWVVVLVIVVFVFLIFFYRAMADSRFFAVRAVAVEGNVLLSEAEIDRQVRSVATRGTLRVDLDQVRSTLQHHEVIKEARVIRMLPDMLKVVITERQPYALARKRDGTVGCVDLEGVMFGCQELFKPKEMLPLISGLAEGGTQAPEINRQRIAAYQRLLEELNQSPPLLARIDEVVFNDVQMSVILADSRIAVLLGTEDFRKRLNAAFDVLDAVNRGDAEALNVLRISDAERLLSGARISYLNATIPQRIVVGLEE